MMFIGSLALAGIFPFAGFYSKDIIIEAAYASGTSAGFYAFIFGVLAAFLTSFYSWRLIIYVFHGKCKLSKDLQAKIHESPKSMLLPLMILGLGAVLSGYIGYNLGMVTEDNHFWNGAIKMLAKPNIVSKIHDVSLIIKLTPLIAGILGILLAYIVYIYIPSSCEFLKHVFKPLYLLFKNKYFIDELYDFLFVRPCKKIANYLWYYIDEIIIDGYGPNGLAKIVKKISAKVSALHDGYIYSYAFVMIFGLVVILTYYIIVLLIK